MTKLETALQITKVVLGVIALIELTIITINI